MYYFVWGTDRTTGKSVIWGPIMDSTDAENKKVALVNGRIMETMSKDRSQAVQQIRSQMIDSGKSVGFALQRHASKPKSQMPDIDGDDEIPDF